MTSPIRTAAFAVILLGLPGLAKAEDVTLHFLASQGGIGAFELADALGYFNGTGIKFDNLGNVNAAWSSALVDGTTILRYRRRTPSGWDQPGRAGCQGGTAGK